MLSNAQHQSLARPYQTFAGRPPSTAVAQHAAFKVSCPNAGQPSGCEGRASSEAGAAAVHVKMPAQRLLWYMTHSW